MMIWETFHAVEAQPRGRAPHRFEVGEVLELHAAPALRLERPHDAALVQLAHGFRRQLARRFRLRGALAQARDHRAGTRHCFGVG
jgi:hypothetical protein